MKDYAPLDSDPSIESKSPHLPPISIILSPGSIRHRQETLSHHLTDEHMTINSLMKPSQYREHHKIIQPNMPQSTEIQAKRLRIVVVQKRQTYWIATLYSKRIDCKICRMPVAECNIGAINTYTFHSIKKAALVVSSG